MKRSIEVLDMATSLMLLSQVGKAETKSAKIKPVSSGDSDRVFTCKTCDRQFASFQALGGHRASHKKPRLEGSPAVGVKAHECSICGMEFPIGQALGGHMRKHRNANAAVLSAETSSSGSGASPDPVPVPVLKKCSSKRVMCLDLNLTPLENDIKLHMGLVL